MTYEMTEMIQDDRLEMKYAGVPLPEPTPEEMQAVEEIVLEYLKEKKAKTNAA